jgi:recombination protein U
MTGKNWEKCIQKSCEKRIMFCKKLADGTSNWNRNDSLVRFQKSNECDFIIFNGEKLLLLEAKVHKGKSIPLTCIRESQIKGLTEKSIYKNVICGLLILFDDLEEAYFLNIHDFARFERLSERKSIPVSYCQETGLRVPLKKKKINYDIELNDILLK